MHLIRKLNVAVLLWAVAAGAAFAKPIALTAKLTPSAEVPPNDSKAGGSLSGTFDTDTKQLTWTVTYEGLTGPATMAHFHGPAPVGQNAGIVIKIPTAALPSPIKGTATLTEQQAGDLMAGTWYFNVHTQAHPSGEIRGQVSPSH